MIPKSAALEASQAADSFLTLPEALQRIAELEKLSISLFETLKSAHEALAFLQGDSALNAALDIATGNIEAEVTRVLGRPPAMAMQKKGA